MELNMACGAWIKEDDEKVLKALRESDTWLSSEELSEITGLALHKVRRTLSRLKYQMNLYEERKRFLEENRF